MGGFVDFYWLCLEAVFDWLEVILICRGSFYELRCLNQNLFNSSMERVCFRISKKFGGIFL
jgi:hypothetical protein